MTHSYCLTKVDQAKCAPYNTVMPYFISLIVLMLLLCLLNSTKQLMQTPIHN